MPAADRQHLHDQITALREIYLPYQALDDIQQDLEILRQRDNRGSEGGILILTGPSRSGKTKVLKDFARLHPEQPGAIRKPNGEFATRKPVVCVKVPDTNEKNLTERLLAALLGVETREVKGMGTRRFDIQDEILQVAAEIETKLVVLDEAHQGIGNRDLKSVGVMSTVLKDLVNGCVFSMAVAGTDRARALQEASDEFRERCIYDYTLDAFNWDNAEHRRVLADVLREYDEHLRENVFGRLSGLAEPGIASALCAAGGGLIGSVAVLVENGGKMAADDMLAGGAKCLTLDHLAKAFRKSSLRRVIECDPFPGSKENGTTARVGPGVMTGLKGRTRQAGHDVQFRR